jgi:DNA-binding MarR family transcriptional regulator
MATAIKFHFTNPEDSSGFLLWQVTMLWQRKIKKGLDNSDITHTQFVLLASLAWLVNKNDIVTQTDIASHSKTDRMMVSKVLRTLQQKGFVQRQEHETDTRAKTISLTAKGENVLQKALKLVEKTDIVFFKVLQKGIANYNKQMLTLMKENAD